MIPTAFCFVLIITILTKWRKIMFAQLSAMMKKPPLYEKGTVELWTDEHISKGMLDAHLNPDEDGATRKHDTVRDVVKWIGTTAPVEQYPSMLDLGCGPGIYAEEFHKAGYKVTGMDISERSINYARQSAERNNLPIEYHHRDYLSLDFKGQYDLVTIIYCDFGVLSTEDRAKLLMNIHAALKPGGLLIFDVFTPLHYAEQQEYKSWGYAENGFFCDKPHVRLDSRYRYDDEMTYCNQHIIITEQGVGKINIWGHAFTKEEITKDLQIAGFGVKSFFGSLTGVDYQADGKEMCIVAQK